MRNRERGFWFLAGGVGMAAVGLGIGLVMAFAGGDLTGGASTPPARARAYADFQACLLTSDRGVADPAAAPLWAGMEQASLATRAKVSYLAVTGPQTRDNALPFLGALLVRHCGVVLAAGQAQRDAIADRARQYPSVKFAVVGGISTAPNITVLSGNAMEIQAGAAGEVSRATAS